MISLRAYALSFQRLLSRMDGRILQVNLGDFWSDGSVPRPLDVEEQHAQLGVQ